MNIDTGEIGNFEEMVQKMVDSGMSREIAQSKLLPLTKDEHEDAKTMNRAQRRAWARKQRKQH